MKFLAAFLMAGEERSAAPEIAHGRDAVGAGSDVDR
jgi:hypothetical protein